jgi:phosphoglycerate dehydrogenase-like enzyme
MYDQPLFRIWFERAIPSRYAPMLEGVATVAPDPSEADGIVAGSRVPYNADFFQKAPALQVVSRTGIGYDNIRVQDATARRIAVCNAPDSPSISTAEHTIARSQARTRNLACIDGVPHHDVETRLHRTCADKAGEAVIQIELRIAHGK